MGKFKGIILVLILLTIAVTIESSTAVASPRTKNSKVTNSKVTKYRVISKSQSKNAALTQNNKISKVSLRQKKGSYVKLSKAKYKQAASRRASLSRLSAKADKAYFNRADLEEKQLELEDRNLANTYQEPKYENSDNSKIGDSELSSSEEDGFQNTEVNAAANLAALDSFKNADSQGFSIDHVGPFMNSDGKRFYEVLPSGDKVALTLDAKMQSDAEDLLRSYGLPYATLVAIEPSTGRVKAIAGYSNVISKGVNLTAQSTFPAASLFKMITAAAAVEKVGVNTNTPVYYRGGTYALGPHNYLPNSKKDRMMMTLGQAMGKSCNPVFARVALNYLSPNTIKQYASNFGFGKRLSYDFPVNVSTLSLSPDNYSFARTAAGFGDAYISPVHAAAIVAALGNQGVMMRPYIVDGVVVGPGKVKVLDNMKVMQQVVNPSTSDEILTMMQATVTDGTARKHFKIASPDLRSITVAAKTGTLKGKNPEGVYHWFAAVAPVNNPKIAISALVIDSGRARVNGAGLGRRFLEKVFDRGSLTESAKVISKNSHKPIS